MDIVIRIPPYPWQYNAVELAWAQEKEYMSKNNNAFKFM
jgi:hypothetical protein